MEARRLVYIDAVGQVSIWRVSATADMPGATRSWSTIATVDDHFTFRTEKDSDFVEVR